ncbi:MAG: Cysteine desulfuration protein SufE [Chlamydiae bacterium]|nr:Cysteine desulfuration protein SufE [Chlamydiota bacterium]
MNLEKREEIQASFQACETTESIYQTIMEWGKKLPPFPEEEKREENLVSGCQSLLYLHTEMREGKVYFSATTDALISAGLAALLITFYNGVSPETLLTTPPSFLEEWNIPASLTPGRANGLASLFQKMQRDSLKFLTSR